MRAENRSIKAWLNDIDRGFVRLPRFQRRESWKRKNVEDFLNAVIRRNSPIGVLLVLEVNPDKPPFETRPLEGTVNNGEKCRQHLLDGQQRLTALWKAMKDKYKDWKYYIPFQEDERGGYKLEDDKKIISIARTGNNWIGNPADEYQKGYIPVGLLYPGEEGVAEATNWRYETNVQENKLQALEIFIATLREGVSSQDIPFLSLPIETDADEAIEVFISTNTSFVKLTHFNIAVAQFEAATKNSLQDLIDKLAKAVPGIKDFEGVDGAGDLALKVACLLQNKKPTYGNYQQINMKVFQSEWDVLVDGIKWAIDILYEEKIWDGNRLPSTVPLRVLPALHRYMPAKGDDRASADRLIRKYLWRAFTTDWYERQANDRLNKDYKALKVALIKKTFKCPRENTIFGSPLPDIHRLCDEGWPKDKGILKRAILAICIKHGASDVASNQKISSPQIIRKRQYHHIFPRALLVGEKRNLEPDLAMNCMLLDDSTNNEWDRSWPGDYLLKKVMKAKKSGLEKKEAIQVVKKRLKSHLIPADTVMNATENTDESLEEIYNGFLRERAEMVLDKMESLCEKGEI